MTSERYTKAITTLLSRFENIMIAPVDSPPVALDRYSRYTKILMILHPLYQERQTCVGPTLAAVFCRRATGFRWRVLFFCTMPNFRPPQLARKILDLFIFWLYCIGIISTFSEMFSYSASTGYCATQPEKNGKKTHFKIWKTSPLIYFKVCPTIITSVGVKNQRKSRIL